MPKPKSLNLFFLFAVLALSAVGLLLVFSASPTMALKHGDTFFYLKRELFYLAIGALALVYGLKLDLQFLKGKAGLILLVSLGLLLVIFIPGVGRKVLGASRWIDLGILSFQPSELIKFSLVLFFASWFADKSKTAVNLGQIFLLPLLLLGLVAILIMRQPDLGTLLVIGATSFALFFLAGLQVWHLAALGGLAGLAILVLSLMEPYRLRRLMAYLDPWKDPQGTGFQIIQSLLAVGSGGFLGLGLGASRQKFFYLPQQFTDFIFAILCEELGFLGGITVVGFFLVFAYQGLRIALSANESFKMFLAAGLTCWLTSQALINLMVVLGLIPTTGIPLPFISYGGTATIINLFAAGVILNVSQR